MSEILDITHPKSEENKFINSLTFLSWDIDRACGDIPILYQKTNIKQMLQDIKNNIRQAREQLIGLSQNERKEIS